MAKINFLISPLHPTKFSGGIWCIFEYAFGLCERGHLVSIIPTLPSPKPEWFPKNYGQFISTSSSTELKTLLISFSRALSSVTSLKRGNKKRIKANFKDMFANLALIGRKAFPYDFKKGMCLAYVRKLIPEADATIATSFDTALVNALVGTGRLFYFMQHYEPYFKNEAEIPAFAEREANLSYRLGLHMIANSSWLRSKIQKEIKNAEVFLSPNAIDHEVFQGQPKLGNASQEIKVISYGGRNAIWKGFKEMAEAIKITRESLPNLIIRWLVFGDALLPPDNSLAKYEPLGFLNPHELVEAYKRADILLSASWYESFPLFPLEAMACGLPIITTQHGTEEYAIPGETAEVVEPKNPTKIAEGLIRLIKDMNYRNSLAKKGNEMSKRFNWKYSAENMEKILLSNFGN
jgi:glycosyltransferase involved in cell wall biosynthesis